MMHTDHATHADDVAIFGGSFDPPHAGHVAVVRWLVSQADIGMVLIVPCFSHAFAKQSSPFDERMQMCRIAFAEFGEQVVVSDIEADLPSPSYTIDTITELQRRHPSWRMRIVIGSDIPSETTKWRNFDRISQIAPPILVNRGGMPAMSDSPVFPRVSSTVVRRRLAVGLSCDGLVPAGVERFIQMRQLYPAPDNSMPDVVICGCGRVGTSLALAFARDGVPATVVDRPDVLAERTDLPESITRRHSVYDVSVGGRAVWFVCAGDADVLPIIVDIDRLGDSDLDSCAVVSATAPISGDWKIPVCRTHPLKAFPPADLAIPLPSGTVFAVQSAPADVIKLLDALSAVTFELKCDDLATYHAAAVLASNLPGALAFESAAMFRVCGVPNPELAAMDLMRSMLDNLLSGGFDAISGPAARGDSQTVAADQVAVDRFDGKVGTVHRILADVIARDIFGHAHPVLDGKEQDIEPGK